MPCKREPAAQQRHHGDGDGHHGREHGAERGGDDVGLDADLPVFGADSLKLGDGLLFAGKGLDHAHAGDVLLHHRVERAQVGLHLAEGLAAVAGHRHGDVEHQRQHEHDAQGKLPVEQKHGDHDAAQQQDVGGEFDEAIGQHAVDGFGVIGHAAHEIADAMVIVVGHGERLHVGEEVGADIAHQPLRHNDHDHALDDGGHARRNVHGQHQQGDPNQPRHIAGHDIAVDGDAEQDRPGQLPDGGDHHQHGHHDQLQPIRAQIAEQASHGKIGVLGALSAGAAARPCRGVARFCWVWVVV